MNAVVKTDYKSWDRPKKNVARTLAKPSGLVTNTLWLPGWTCLDVLQAYEQDLLDPHGRHVVVEGNPSTMGKIKKNLGRLKVKFEYHTGLLTSYKVTTPLDYAHVDYCGGIDYATACWIRRLPISRNAEINFTFAYAPRGNTFVKQCHELFMKNKEYHRILVREYVDLDREDINIAVYCTALRCFLRNYSFTMLRPTYYKDEIQSMSLYQFCNFKPSKSPVYPDLTEEFGGVSRKSRLVYLGG